MNKKGFSMVEVMISLFVATIFVSIGYGMYAYVYKDISYSKKRAIASNIAESHLRERASLSELSDCDKPINKRNIIESLKKDEKLTGFVKIHNNLRCDPNYNKIMIFEVIVEYEIDGYKQKEKQVLYVDKK